MTDEDAGRERDFEEPAFPWTARARSEPPLRIGRWTDFFDDKRDDNRDDRHDVAGADAANDPAHTAACRPGGRQGGDPGDGFGLGPERMVEAAVPRARGARRILPGDDGPSPEAANATTARERHNATTSGGRVKDATSTAVITGVVETTARATGRATAPVGIREPAAGEGSDASAGTRVAERGEEHVVVAAVSDGAIHEVDRMGGPFIDHTHVRDVAADAGSGDTADNSGVNSTDNSADNSKDDSEDHEATTDDGYTFDNGSTGVRSGVAVATAQAADPALAPVAIRPPSKQLELRRDHHTTDGDNEHGPDPADPTDTTELQSVRGPFEIATLIGTAAVVTAALLYYFGWARSAAIADFLGLDEDMLGYTTKEYFVRGVDALYRPLLAAIAVLLGVRTAHPRLLAFLRRHPRSGVCFSWLLRCAWFAVPAAAWIAAFRWPGHWAPRWPLMLPGALTVGVLVSAYGVVISRQSGARRRTGTRSRPWSLSTVLTASAVVLCLFWTLGAYAQAEGRATAHRMVRELPTRTAVVVFSTQDLHVATGQGVTAEALTQGESPYRFRYAGLRLLRRADGRLYLLPDRWSWERPRLIVVREDARVRVDYLRSR